VEYTYKLKPISPEATCGTPWEKMRAANEMVAKTAVEWEKLTTEMLYWGAVPSRMRRFIKEQGKKS